MSHFSPKKILLFALSSLICAFLTSCKTTEKEDLRSIDSGPALAPDSTNAEKPATLPENTSSLSLAEEIQRETDKIRHLCKTMSQSLSSEEKLFCQKVDSASDEALSVFFQTGYLNRVLEGRVAQSEREKALLSGKGMQLASYDSKEEKEHPKRSLKDIGNDHLVFAAYAAVFVLGYIELDATWSLIKATKVDLKKTRELFRARDLTVLNPVLKTAYGVWGLFIAVSLAQHLDHLTHGPTDQTWKDLGETFVIAGLFSFGVAYLSSLFYDNHLKSIDALNDKLKLQVRGKNIEGKATTLTYDQWKIQYKEDLKTKHNAVENFIREKYQVDGTISKHSAPESPNKKVAEFLETADHYKHGVSGEKIAGVLQMAAAAAFVSIGYVMANKKSKDQKDPGKDKGHLHLTQSDGFKERLQPVIAKLLSLAQQSPNYPESSPP